MGNNDAEPRFTAEEIRVAIQSLLQAEAVLAAPVSSELTRIIYTGLERSGAMRRLDVLADVVGKAQGRSPSEVAVHFGFQLGFRVRSTLLDAEGLHALYAREG